jgi:hypothetical protein
VTYLVGDVTERTEQGYRKAKPPDPRPKRCAVCQWTPSPDGTWLRLGDDRQFVQAGQEMLCSLCATGQDREQGRG